MRPMLSPRARVRGVHHSSRFSRSPASARRAAKRDLLHHDLVTGTEYGNDARLAALKGIPGTTLATVNRGRGRGECVALLKNWKWKKISWEVVKLSDELTPDRGDTLIYGLVVTATHWRTHQVIKVLVVHLPAHMEEAMDAIYHKRSLRRFSDDALQNAKTWLESVDTMRHLVARWLDDPKIDLVYVAADWNLNFDRLWVRRFVGSYFPGLRLNPPTGPTHTTRRIDAVYSNLVEQRAKTLPPDGSSDHRAIEVLGQIHR